MWRDSAKTFKKPLRDTEQYGDEQREGRGQVDEGKAGEQTVTEGDLTWGDEHTIWYTDDVR